MRKLRFLLLFGLVFLLARPLSVASAPTAPAGEPSNLYLPFVTRDVWQYIVQEDFEGAWPKPGWTISNSDDNYLWGVRTCQANSGTHSAWIMGAGLLGSHTACGASYYQGMEAWMTYGPFNFHGATKAEFYLQAWMHENNGDGLALMISTDNDGYAGHLFAGQNTAGEFVPIGFDISSYASADQVWVAVYFTSIYVESFPEGAYVDDIVVRTCATGCPTLSADLSNTLTSTPISLHLPDN